MGAYVGSEGDRSVFLFTEDENLLIGKVLLFI
jgi:hypothetical protein